MFIYLMLCVFIFFLFFFFFQAEDGIRDDLVTGVQTCALPSYDAVDGAAALAIVTEWLEYRNPDFERIKRALTRPVIVDGRNLYDPQRMARLGFIYESIGRPVACASS